MNVKWVYEIIDLRKHVRHRLPAIGQIKTCPGGLEVWGMTSSIPMVLTPDDNDPEGVIDDEAYGRLEVNTFEGRVIFQKLGLGQKDAIRAMFSGVPELKTDEDVQKFFLSRWEN